MDLLKARLNNKAVMDTACSSGALLETAGGLSFQKRTKWWLIDDPRLIRSGALLLEQPLEAGFLKTVTATCQNAVMDL
jgi:hypothetical protein